jgi:hypothetical protein
MKTIPSVKSLLTSVFVLALGLTHPQSANAWTIGFDQIDWLNNTGGYTDYESDWGFATFQLSSADAGSFQSGPFGYLAYLNITTTVPGGGTDNWAVQNMPLWFSSLGEMDMQTTYGLTFDLGITAGSNRVSSLDYCLTIDPAPLASPPIGSQTAASVGISDWLFGGAGDISGTSSSGNTGDSFPGNAVNFVGASPDNPAVAGASINVAPSNIVAVTEDENGCVPGATTRSLFYLKSNGIVNFSGSVSNVYQTLVSNMNTSLGASGTGTTGSNFFKGKSLWLQSNNVPIVTMVTNAAGAISWITNGADVEAWIRYVTTNLDGTTSTNFHMAFVSSLTVLSNGDGIISIIDSPQNGSTTNRVWDITVHQDGMSNLGNNTRIQFIVEIPEPTSIAFGTVIALTLVAMRWQRHKR